MKKIMIYMVLAVAAVSPSATIAQIQTKALPPAFKPTPNQTYVQCSAYDFNHDLSYSSRLFFVHRDLTESSDLSPFVTEFASAISAQFHIVVDMRHVRCDLIGTWRVQAELTHQTELDGHPDLIPKDERRVAWPESPDLP